MVALLQCHRLSHAVGTKTLFHDLDLTINTDDPPLFGTTLTDEYLCLANTFGFDRTLIEQLVLNGVRASLLPPDIRQSLEKDFRAQFAQLQAEL